MQIRDGKNMLIEQLEKKKDFTASEVLIADYVISHSMQIMDLTAEQLAEKTYTSKSSVIRFCKKMGMKGYREFQNQIIYEINALNKAHKAMSYAVLSADSSMKDIIGAVPFIYESSISKMWATLDEAALKKAAARIRDSYLVEIYGVGSSGILAEETAFKLRSLGISCTAEKGLNEHAVETWKDMPRKTAILLSATGRNPYIISAAKYLKKRGYYLIGVGGGSSDTLSSLCTQYFSTETDPSFISLEIITSMTAMRFVLDVLFTALFVDDYNVNIDRAMRVFKSRYFDE